MSHSPNSTTTVALRGLAWLLFASAVFAFWAGGWVISGFAQTDRMLAEMEGIGVALALAALGFLAKEVAERIDERAAERNSRYPVMANHRLRLEISHWLSVRSWPARHIFSVYSAVKPMSRSFL